MNAFDFSEAKISRFDIKLYVIISFFIKKATINRSIYS